MSAARITYLLQQLTAGIISPGEKEELERFLLDGKLRDSFTRVLHEMMETNKTGPVWNGEGLNEMVENILSADKTGQSIDRRPAKLFTIRRWAAAAAILVLAGTGGYFIDRNIKRHGTAIAKEKIIKNDIAPGHNGAVLTLSNGQKIILDSAGNGLLANDKSVRVIKKDGEIIYQGKGGETVYNDVSTDKGRQWQLTLSDGTKVWLNAVSSIRYPLSFSGKERLVEISGEAYFEVVHNPKMPFKVKVGNQIIEDIGTHFNINAYRDEPAVRTTLIEGLVKVVLGSSAVIIKPGEQASLATGGNKILVSPADVDAAIAWKNGVFELTNADVASIMRQVSRWYDVEVTYKGDVPKGTISGEVPRSLKLSEVLKVLALSGVRCELKERKLLVFE